MAENLRKKNNKKIATYLLLLLSLFVTNLCWAGPEEENLTDDFFKAAMQVESVNDSQSEQTDAASQDNNNENKAENETVKKISENIKTFTDNSVEKIKTYSIQFNNFAEKTTKGNKLLAKLMIISVLTVISILLIFILLIIFKLLFGRKKSNKNPFSSSKFENQQTVDNLSEQDFEIEDTDEVQEAVPEKAVIEDETKSRLISEPSPTDIKSAVNLFIKITSK